MKKHCIECGKELKSTYNVCIHCGTPVDQEKETPAPKPKHTPKKPKKPMTQKQKLTWTIVASVIVVLIGFSMWANHYHSAESVEKRFEKAVDDKDGKKLSKLMIRGDDSFIEEFEAEAFIKLVAQRGQGMKSQMTTVEQSGKFLGIYDTHKMKVIDQFAIGFNTEGLTYTFNNKKIDEYERTEETVSFGPLAPGVYTVKVEFDGAFGDFETEDEVTLDLSHDFNEIDIDIPINEVEFYVENYHRLDASKITVQVGDEMFSISEEGNTERIGPLVTDGSLEATVHAEMPWGEVKSEPIQIVDAYMYVLAQFISPDQFEKALDAIENFGEQYVQSVAEKSTKPLKSVSNDVKKYVENQFDDYYDAYTGKLTTISVNENSLHVETSSDVPKMIVPVQYVIEEDYHNLDDDPDLSEYKLTGELELSFNSDDESWQIDAVVQQYNYFTEFNATDTWGASGKIYGPDEKQIAKAEQATLENELFEFIEDYTRANVDAINRRDFDLMSDYITEDGPRRDEARDYIDYLDSEDVYETWFGSELEEVEETDNDTWKVTVIEEFEIRWPDKIDVKEFRTKLIIKEIDGEFFVDELTETNET